MGVVAEQVSTAPSAARGSNFAGARTLADDRPMLPRWRYTTALAVGLVAVFMSPGGRDAEDVAQLERLVPKIERAQTLSPEARETINRLIARQTIARGWDDPSQQMRRKAAIERVTSAMQAKESIPAVSDVASR
ncbi:MAG TPA: hypothetical protein VK512_02805 [Xanthobacteraceae bacterium]|nr:hypothetical protein [Xanthobacteraceae bacterium]